MRYTQNIKRYLAELIKKPAKKESTPLFQTGIKYGYSDPSRYAIKAKPQEKVTENLKTTVKKVAEKKKIYLTK